MSHVVAFKEIVIPESAVADGTLAQALDELGLELQPGKTTYKWYGRWMNDYNTGNAAYRQGVEPSTYGQCVHAVKVKGAGPNDYELGLIRNPDGAGLIPAADFWGSGGKIKDAIGEKCEKLGTAYSRAAIQAQASRQGYALTEQAVGGKIKLTAVRYAV
jgi:hypothetical protein